MGLATWGGFALLFTASAWNGNLLHRINLCRREWSAVRTAHVVAELERAKQLRAEAEQAREESMRARQAAIASSLSPSANGSGGFGKLHLAMSPPTFVYRAEETNAHHPRNAVGALRTHPAASSHTMPPCDSPISPNDHAPRRGHHSGSSDKLQTSSASPVATSLSATAAVDASYASEGFSLELKTPNVSETTIKVTASPSVSSVGSRGVNVHLSAPTGAHGSGLSPTVQSTPSALSSQSHLSVHGGGGGGGEEGHKLFAYPAASPMSTNAFSTSFAEVALTPANGEGRGFASPASGKERHKHSPHTPGQMVFHPSTTDISPRTGVSVRQHFEELQQASSPFNAEKYRQQKAEEARQRTASQADK
jgi:hypothetical protein